MKIIPLINLLAFLALAGAVLSACGPAAPTVRSEKERVTAPVVPGGDSAALVDGNNAFALDLYQALRATDGNLFYSPYSISMALAMTYGGASGNTAAQMAEALHFDLAQEALHPAFNLLDLNLAQGADDPAGDLQPLELKIANAVWAQQEHPFLVEYLDLLALNYGAGIHPADFTTQAELVRKEINRWVSDQTNDRIRDILAPGTLDALTRMVLVNAIYFKADWQSPFDANDTYDAPFHLLDGTETQVEMMSNDGLYIPYADGENYQVVELPYAGGTAVMDIIVPDEGSFDTFDAALDWETLEAILASLQPVDLSLRMPKFTFTSQFSLSVQLAGMGMTDAFDPAAADFSGMDGLRDLYISNVIHQAFVAVDEKGTEAAAATAVIMTLTSMPMRELELTIDRPFFFLIRDLSSGQILFAGRVLNP
ncbi:MAG: serpin family protein [Chloroflexi bacterium]|nr:serpin family protein [Chloroflexota bacterium]